MRKGKERNLGLLQHTNVQCSTNKTEEQNPSLENKLCCKTNYFREFLILTAGPEIFITEVEYNIF